MGKQDGGFPREGVQTAARISSKLPAGFPPDRKIPIVRMTLSDSTEGRA